MCLHWGIRSLTDRSQQTSGYLDWHCGKINLTSVQYTWHPSLISQLCLMEHQMILSPLSNLSWNYTCPGHFLPPIQLKQSGVGDASDWWATVFFFRSVHYRAVPLSHTDQFHWVRFPPHGTYKCNPVYCCGLQQHYSGYICVCDVLSIRESLGKMQKQLWESAPRVPSSAAVSTPPWAMVLCSLSFTLGLALCFPSSPVKKLGQLKKLKLFGPWLGS